MKLTGLIIIALVAIAWLMPLIYQPATPYAWGALGLYAAAVVGKAIYNHFTLDRKRRGPGAYLLLLPLLAAAASCASKAPTTDAVTERPQPDSVATFTNAQGFEEPVAAR